VTRADRLANALIVAALSRAFPTHGIVAEESVPEPDELVRLLGRERVFFVDPIDGTREFAEGRDDFAVMIGLAVGGRATAGVLAIPAEGVILSGTVGGGANRTGRDGVTTSVRVGSCTSAREGVVIVSRSHRPPDLAAVLERLGSPRELPCGSVGVKVARVALGDADLYLHPGSGAKKWDSCAPEAVLRAAGGELGDVFGDPIDYAAPDLALRRGMCAGNAALFAEGSRAAREVLGSPT
jgi:3'(2'), 5'-bisphosphate nucleotidase